MIRASAAVAVGLALAACGSPDYLPTEDLMKPETCMQCHPKHFREWSGSMHAYAGDDPVFLAMNARGQTDTGGALGAFCVGCHAPVALRLGLTTDGTNLASVPAWAKGVTCFFCHSVTSVGDTHNNPLVLAADDTLRGGIIDPIDNPAHRTKYSPLHDGNERASSSLCGSCHDIVNGHGVRLERTFEEWQTTIFADDRRPPLQQVSCGRCHMFSSTDVVADVAELDVPQRQNGRHEHTFAGIDVALTPWPETDAQRAAIDRDLRGALIPKLCFDPAGRLAYTLDNVGNGHKWPSGAAQDRRAWVELVAYDAAGNVLYQSGVVSDGADPDGSDPELYRMWDDIFDAAGDPTHMFWEVASHDDSTLLAPATTTCPSDPAFYHAREFVYPTLNPVNVARITARTLIRSMPLALFDELGLDPSLAAQVPTHELTGTRLEWTPATASPQDHCVKPPPVPPITPFCP